MTNPLVSKYFEELITHQNRVMRELLQGKITPKEASAIHRAVSRKLTLAQVAERYVVNVRTITRWTADEKLGFPRPLIINRSKLWDEEELMEWERDRARAMTTGKW